MDSFWTQYDSYILFVPTAILSIVAIWYTRKQLQKKRLEYKIVANENLLSYSQDLEKDLIITYKNNKVNNLVLFSILIQNTGNIPILRGDFDSDIKIQFVSINSIISAELTGDGLSNFDLVIDPKFKTLSIPPLLINPRDKIIMKVLIDSNSEMPFFVIESRIAGISKIKKEEYSKRLNSLSIGLIISFIILLCFIFIIFFNFKGFRGLSFIDIGMIIILSFHILTSINYIKFYTKLNK